MASRWTRSPVDTICGHCQREIAVGAPVLEIQLPGVTRPKLRCARRDCAGPAPPDLPPYVERDNTITPSRLAPRFTRTTKDELTRALPFDGKAAAIAREPGSDDE